MLLLILTKTKLQQLRRYRYCRTPFAVNCTGEPIYFYRNVLNKLQRFWFTTLSDGHYRGKFTAVVNVVVVDLDLTLRFVACLFNRKQLLEYRFSFSLDIVVTCNAPYQQKTIKLLMSMQIYVKYMPYFLVATVGYRPYKYMPYIIYI